MGEKNNQGSQIGALVDALQSEPEDAALSLLSTAMDASGRKESLQQQLRAVCSEIFERIEVLNTLRSKLIKREKEPSLSGLAELYTGENGDDDEPQVNAETLFGQVDLMNHSLASKVKKSLKKLSTSLERGGVIRLLDDENVSDSEASAAEEPVAMNNAESDGDIDDEERKRIGSRMQHAMDDVDEDDEAAGEAGGTAVQHIPAENSESDMEESVTDPAAEELNDGFFDINEMEKFADEEEEYLPDEAFGEEKLDEKDGEDQDKRSFHQKQRDGDLDDNEEDESEQEDDILLFKTKTLVRRKHYRDEDEIDALYELYQDGNNQHSDLGDDDSAADVVNMTAADLYGKPNKKYFEKWNASRATSKNEKLDDDSWDEYDFDKSGDKETGRWSEGEMDDDKSDSSEGEDPGSDKDEILEMKDTKEENRSKTGKGKTTGDKLDRQTYDLERELLAEKPWQMRGETSGNTRPAESLLEATPEFEVATKQAPIITVEKTMDLEEVIKKRILNEDWDDVVPRELPDVVWNKKRGELPEVSQEKSKLGLGELYEREYMKKALGYDADKAEKQSEEEKVKSEIKGLFANLCSKLDALSNYHFAPRPVGDEAEVRPVTQPAIAMEEVLPLHFSEARGVAPEEVYGAKRGRDGVLRADSELEQQDRKRLRSAKKAARRKARKEKVADEKLLSKLQPGLGLNNPYEKRKMREELSVARSQGRITTGEADANKYDKSGTFFQRMQKEAQHSIRGNTPKDMEESKGSKNKSIAVKL